MPGAGKICLFIVPIGEPESKIIRSNQVYKHIVKRAAKACKYVAMRSDKLPGPSEPTTPKILRYLRDADIVIADLTGLNQGIFYQLGYRHALHKPAIILMQIIQKRSKKLPREGFDYPIIYVDLNVDKVKESRAELIRKIREAEEEKVTKARKTKRGTSKTRKIGMRVPKAKPLLQHRRAKA